MSETQHIEDRITQALVTIRREWPHMLPTGPAPIRYGVGRQARITADDHAETGADIDATTALVSLRREVVDTLNGWSRLVMDDRPVTKALPDGMSALSMCAFLERHARWMSGHEAAEDMADEVEPLADRVRQFVDPPRRDWIVLGDCPFVHEGWFCRGQVRWWDVPGRDPACTECGQETVLAWWEDVLGVVRVVTYDGLQEFIRKHTGQIVARPTIRTWLNRGHIQSCGVDAQGRTLFDKTLVAEFLAHRHRAA